MIIYSQPLRAVHILINIHIFTAPDSSFTEATNIHQTLFIQDKVEKSLKQEQDKRSKIAELLDWGRVVSYHYIWTHIYRALHRYHQPVELQAKVREGYTKISNFSLCLVGAFYRAFTFETLC